MKRLSQVLCAVDIGEAGRLAFAHALALSRAHGAKLTIVCAVPPTQAFNAGGAERLAYLLELRATAEAAGLEVRIDVQHGPASKVLLLHARTRRPDLLVLAAEHNADPNRDGAGSVVEDIVRGADCPILVVRGDQQPPASRRFTSVLCAIDFSAASRAAIERAASLAASGGGRLSLLHVLRRSDGSSDSRSTRHAPRSSDDMAPATLQRLQGLIPTNVNSPVRIRVAVGNVATEILSAARASHADIIVVGTQSRRRLGRRVFGVIDKLLREAPCPILAVPAPKSRVNEDVRWRPAA